MADDRGRALAALEQATADRREATGLLADAIETEHAAVWAALDAGASWRELAWLTDEPLATLYHRHRERGNPRPGKVL